MPTRHYTTKLLISMTNAFGLMIIYVCLVCNVVATTSSPKKDLTSILYSGEIINPLFTWGIHKIHMVFQTVPSPLDLNSCKVSIANEIELVLKENTLDTYLNENWISFIGTGKNKSYQIFPNKSSKKEVSKAKVSVQVYPGYSFLAIANLPPQSIKKVLHRFAKGKHDLGDYKAFLDIKYPIQILLITFGDYQTNNVLNEAQDLLGHSRSFNTFIISQTKPYFVLPSNTPEEEEIYNAGLFAIDYKDQEQKDFLQLYMKGKKVFGLDMKKTGYFEMVINKRNQVEIKGHLPYNGQFQELIYCNGVFSRYATSPEETLKDDELAVGNVGGKVELFLEDMLPKEFWELKTHVWGRTALGFFYHQSFVIGKAEKRNSMPLPHMVLFGEMNLDKIRSKKIELVEKHSNYLTVKTLKTAFFRTIIVGHVKGHSPQVSFVNGPLIVEIDSKLPVGSKEQYPCLSKIKFSIRNGCFKVDDGLMFEQITLIRDTRRIVLDYKFLQTENACVRLEAGDFIELIVNKGRLKLPVEAVSTMKKITNVKKYLKTIISYAEHSSRSNGLVAILLEVGRNASNKLGNELFIESLDDQLNNLNLNSQIPFKNPITLKGLDEDDPFPLPKKPILSTIHSDDKSGDKIDDYQSNSAKIKTFNVPVSPVKIGFYFARLCWAGTQVGPSLPQGFTITSRRLTIGKHLKLGETSLLKKDVESMTSLWINRENGSIVWKRASFDQATIWLIQGKRVELITTNQAQIRAGDFLLITLNTTMKPTKHDPSKEAILLLKAVMSRNTLNGATAFLVEIGKCFESITVDGQRHKRMLATIMQQLWYSLPIQSVVFKPLPFSHRSARIRWWEVDRNQEIEERDVIIGISDYFRIGAGPYGFFISGTEKNLLGLFFKMGEFCISRQGIVPICIKVIRNEKNIVRDNLFEGEITIKVETGDLLVIQSLNTGNMNSKEASLEKVIIKADKEEFISNIWKFSELIGQGLILVGRIE